MPKVDVIVPAYNAGRFLATSLESVIAQTFQDWRIVLVDDGSTDDTDEIARNYAARLGRRLLHLTQSNKGVSAARNAAIHASDSEYIAMMDGDDVWLPERLELSVRALDQHPDAGLSYGFVSCIDDMGKVISTHDQLHSGAEGRVARSLYTRSVDVPCVTVTVRRAVLNSTGAFDETMHASEDRDLWLRIAQKSDVVRVPKIIALYRRSQGSLTTGGQRMFDAQMRFVEKHRGSASCDETARRIAVSSIYRQRAETLGAQGRTIQALRDAVHALLLNPLHTRHYRTLISLLWNGLRRKGIRG